ncbi:MAG: hypothetical protein GF313_14305 [Caldithrix sp.]|nr:hypothetical protein [Caldithrix sp.]
MRLFIIFVILIAITGCDCRDRDASFTNVKSDRTTTAQRQAFYGKLVAQIIEGAFLQGLSDSTEKAWQGAFWGMTLSRHRSDITRQAIETALTRYKHRSVAFRRALLEVMITVYPHQYIQNISSIFRQEREPRLFAMSLYYLSANTKDRTVLQSYRQRLYNTFPAWQEDPILLMAEVRLRRQMKTQKQEPPALVDLLANRFDGPLPVLFSIQREDRRFPGRLIVRKPDGQFLRTRAGNLFNVGQLAMAASNMPAYLTNGNAPQGVYSMQGFGRSDNVFIGPSATLQLRLPYEVSADTFFHNGSDVQNPDWSRSRYRQLLPASWRDYLPLYEAFYSGKAGRTAIIAHGTTISPDYYKDELCYPFTPSLGCLTTLEIWDDDTGCLSLSGQQALVSALKSNNIEYGYFVVVNKDDRQGPVAQAEILPHVLQAEKRLTQSNK